jgi:hypothetical protein
MQTASRARLLFLLWNALLFAGVMAPTGLVRSLKPTAASVFTQSAAPLAPDALALADRRILARLDALISVAPGDREWGWVLGCLQHGSWRIAGGALRVLERHQPPPSWGARAGLVARALQDPAEDARPAESFAERRQRIALLAAVLDRADAASDPLPTDLLVRVVTRGPDAASRARALELVAARPGVDMERLALSALDDPSERVRWTAMGLMAAAPWPSSVRALERIAGSGRPALERRARALLDQFSAAGSDHAAPGALAPPARALADALSEAGFEIQDALPAAETGDTASKLERLARAAEEYLDASPARASGASSGTGVLLLAASARLGHTKLARRLWEHEVAGTDSDAELCERGLETLGRLRTVAALAAYQRGDRWGALEALARVARLAPQAYPGGRLAAYVGQAERLSGVIWHATAAVVSAPPALARSDRDPVMDLARRVLGDPDGARPGDEAEVHRRLDACYGVSGTAGPPVRATRALAN